MAFHVIATFDLSICVFRSNLCYCLITSDAMFSFKELMKFFNSFSPCAGWLLGCQLSTLLTNFLYTFSLLFYFSVILHCLQQTKYIESMVGVQYLTCRYLWKILAWISDLTFTFVAWVITSSILADLCPSMRWLYLSNYLESAEQYYNYVCKLIFLMRLRTLVFNHFFYIWCYCARVFILTNTIPFKSNVLVISNSWWHKAVDIMLFPWYRKTILLSS